MNRPVVIVVAGLLAAGLLTSGCDVLKPPEPVGALENVGTDASGSEVVTETRDSDAVARHLADPDQGDDFTMSRPAPKTKSSDLEELRRKHELRDKIRGHKEREAKKKQQEEEGD